MNFQIGQCHDGARHICIYSAINVSLLTLYGLSRRYDESHQRWILLRENKLILKPHGRRQMSHMKQSAVAVGYGLRRCRLYTVVFKRQQSLHHAGLPEARDSSSANGRLRHTTSGWPLVCLCSVWIGHHRTASLKSAGCRKVFLESGSPSYGSHY